MDKLLARLIKSKTEKPQITKIRNERAYFTTDLTVIIESIRVYVNQYYVFKLDNLY